MKVKKAIYHISKSRYGNVLTIDQWHKQRGWSGVGYNLIILNGWITPDIYNPMFDGFIEVGRPFDADNVISGKEIGAHTLGYNSESFGICMISDKGEDITLKQKDSMLWTMRMFQNINPDIEFGGHSDYDSKKPYCPGIDIKEFAKKYKLIK